MNPLGSEKVSILLKKFAIPSIIAMLVSSLYNIVDQIFIGQGVGYLGNAATNVSFPLTPISLAIALLIGIGSASGMSLSLGEGNKEKASQYVSNALVLSVSLGLILLVILNLFLEDFLVLFGGTKENLPYALTYSRIISFGLPMLIVTNVLSNLTRADGSPKFSMTSMLIGALINTILDPLFIFGLKMGIAGAAYATIIGQLASLVFALSYLKRFKTVELNFKNFKLDPKVMATITKLGMSNSLNQLTMSVVQIILNNSLKYYGALSIYGEDIPLAASGIVLKTNAILISVVIGLAQGSQPILGFNYGAKAYSRVKKTYLLACIISTVFLTIGFLVFQFFPHTIISLFGEGDALYFEFAVIFMRTYLLMLPLIGFQIISSNFFSAIGKAYKGVIVSLSRQVLILIPLLIILPKINNLGLNGILIAAPISDFLSVLLTFYLIRKEFKTNLN